MEDVSESLGNEPQEKVVPGLYWGVRDSFLRYVMGNPDGQLYGDGVETDGQGMFRFPFREAQRTADGWRMAFIGDLRFVAHFGMLNVALAEPVVELGAAGGVLTVAGTDGPVPIVRVEVAAPTDVEGRWLVFPPLNTKLTTEGVSVFGDVYPEGTPFDDVRIAIPIVEDPMQEDGES